jgi:uncharacterized membrane protein YuzA (DUF378 family)
LPVWRHKEASRFRQPFVLAFVFFAHEEIEMATVNVYGEERRHQPDRRTSSSLQRTSKAHRMNAVDWIAMALMIVGGLNWGLVGLFNFDLVATLFGQMSSVSRIIYALVGLSALYSIYTSMKIADDN